MKSNIQRLGKSLMHPVAVIPLAALLIGLGYYLDPVDWGKNSVLAAFLLKAGGAVVENLGIIFAVGLGFGMAKDQHGASALASLVAFMTIITLLHKDSAAMLRHFDPAWAEAGNVDNFSYNAFDKIGNGNVFIGILSGILGSAAYNKFYQVKLPDALAFFSGRRLTPIMASLFAMIASLILLFVWPIVYSVLVKIGQTLTGMGAVGAGLYAFLNRLLIPTGLHHALNQVFWFDLIGISDINNFLKNAQETITATYHPGMYQAGFFPIMMFGLPAAGFAMYQSARDERKNFAKSVFLAAGLAAFFTGITEPLEFAFMFVAPQLYIVHAILSGISVFIAAQMGWYAGFGFSAGLFDMLLSIKNPMAENWYMLVLQGLVFAAIYYLLFKVLIKKLNLQTPGREVQDPNEGVVLSEDTNYTAMAKTILEGLGGKENIVDTNYCITRLRLDVLDETKVDEKKIKEAQVAGIIRPSQKHVQVVIGPQVQAVHDEFIKLI